MKNYTEVAASHIYYCKWLSKIYLFHSLIIKSDDIEGNTKIRVEVWDGPHEYSSKILPENKFVYPCESYSTLINIDNCNRGYAVFSIAELSPNGRDEIKWLSLQSGNKDKFSAAVNLSISFGHQHASEKWEVDNLNTHSNGWKCCHWCSMLFYQLDEFFDNPGCFCNTPHIFHNSNDYFLESKPSSDSSMIISSNLSTNCYLTLKKRIALRVNIV